MDMTTQIDESDLLTPSELLALHNDKLSLRHPAEAAFAAAFLVNMHANAIHFEIKSEKKLFGLYSNEILSVDKGSSRSEWPEYSLESKIVEMLNKGPATVSDIVYSILSIDTGNPNEYTLSVIKAGLQARGLMDMHEVKKFLVMTVQEYQIPPRTQELLEKISLAPLQKIISDAQRQSPLWELLIKQIRNGIGRRMEQSSSDGNYD